MGERWEQRRAFRGPTALRINEFLNQRLKALNPFLLELNVTTEATSGQCPTDCLSWRPLRPSACLQAGASPPGRTEALLSPGGFYPAASAPQAEAGSSAPGE